MPKRTLPRRTLVVFFNARTYLPLRETNVSHLLCWQRYSRHRVVYVNVAFGVPWAWLRRLPIDTVIFDTLFLAMHWSPAYFSNKAAQCLPVKDLDCRKIAVIQDEFIHMHLVNEFLREIGITDVLTCSAPSDWRTIYPLLDPSKTQFRTILTGYVDDLRLAKINKKRATARDIDIGYRAARNPYWLGEHGTHKSEIGHRIGDLARRRRFSVDVNNPDSTEFLIGDDWFNFLRRCRTVLGVEGGASVLDYDGSIKKKVETFVEEHPNATFREVRDACFAEDDHKIDLACVSPRHFEASMTRTCQVLRRGRYNGLLKPWVHYIPVEQTYTNLDEVLDAVADDVLVKKIAQRAYQDLVASDRWTYRAFVRNIEDNVIEQLPVRDRQNLRVTSIFVYCWLRVRHALLWRFAHIEASPMYALFYRRMRLLITRIGNLSRRLFARFAPGI
jgi:hypothetical protein